jgi:hypothetical protein
VRLSDWQARAPAPASLGPEVLGVVRPVLASLGVDDRDPDAWIVWGEDPGTRYVVLVPTAAGLIVTHVRVNVPGEGPRASAKLVRWARVQIGELGVETQGGHRLLSFQLEGQILRAADEEADQIGAFALAVFAAIDGRASATAS